MIKNMFNYFPKRGVISISGMRERIMRPRNSVAYKFEEIPKINSKVRRKRELDDSIDAPLPQMANSELSTPFRKQPKNAGIFDKVSNMVIARMIKMRIVKNMTKNGKYTRYSAFIAAGNGNGAIGIAHSKSVNAADAASKATRIASRAMQWFPRFQNRTIFHDDIVKFKATLLYVRPAPSGTGRRCHPAISEMCKCMGIEDISAKVHGSKLPMNVAQAFLLALSRQKTPEEVAQETGMKIVDVLSVYQQGCDELEKTLQEKRYSNLDLKLKLNAGKLNQ